MTVVVFRQKQIIENLCTNLIVVMRCKREFEWVYSVGTKST